MVAACPYPTAQGTQALIGELGRGLHDRGHEVHLVCYHHGAFARPEPFPVHRTPAVPGYRRLRSGPDAAKPALDLLLALRTAQVVRRHGCALIHAHNYEGALAGALAARACGVPLVYHAHNLMADELPRYQRRPTLRPLLRGLGIALDRTVPRLGDRVLALHERLGAALIDLGVEAALLSVVPPGIDARFWAAPEPRSAPGPAVVYAGNIDAYQDLPTLFAALPRVAAAVPGAHLLLATPNDPEEARRLAAAHGAAAHVEVVPAPDAAAMRQVLHRARIGVSPRASWTGFPVKNLDYAAAGLPVVACAGSAFGVVHQETGLVVPDGDPAALADALIALLRDPSRTRALGTAGRGRVAERFSQERMVRGVEEVWAAAFARG